MNRLDNRLMLCAKMVRRGSRLADIGTDHAFLPVWLCRNGVCPSAIAADINPDPLERGRQTVAAAELSDTIELRLSDGLHEIGADEADDIVIAGMGGELIASILDDCHYSRDPEKRFILQPMTKSEELLRWICENGFAVEAQDCCEAAGKCYTVLRIQYTGLTQNADELFYYTGILDPEQPCHRRFLEENAARLDKKARGDKRYAELAKRLRQYCAGPCAENEEIL